MLLPFITTITQQHARMPRLRCFLNLFRTWQGASLLLLLLSCLYKVSPIVPFILIFYWQWLATGKYYHPKTATSRDVPNSFFKNVIDRSVVSALCCHHHAVANTNKSYCCSVFRFHQASHLFHDVIMESHTCCQLCSPTKSRQTNIKTGEL